jgi:carboxyl-terminal processing protease
LSRKQSALIAAVTLLIGIGLGYGAQSLQQRYWSRGAKVDYSSLQALESTLRSKFDGNLDNTKLLDSAKKGLVAAGDDPYTVYLTPSEAKDLNSDLTGSLSGIGAEIGIRASQLTVIAPIDGTPAAKAGLQPKDVIGKINGDDPSGLSLDEAVQKIRGAKGTQVKLMISRGGGEPFEVTITRDDISVPSVKWSMKASNVGDIQVVRFGPDTGAKVQQAAQELIAQGATKFILDVRNDPGGYLDQAVAVASQFVPSGLIVDERRGTTVTDHFDASGTGLLLGKQTIVLINAGSASASEIVAGALQDHKVATILGEKSFGKGSVQEVITLGDGGTLKVTVAHWYTPNGKNISKEGIAPDTEVKLTADDIQASRDPQLDKALELLK